MFRLKRGGIMKSLPLILVMGAIVIGSIATIRYIDNMSPSWATTEAIENAQRIREMEEQAARDREYTEAYTRYIDIALGVVVFGGAGVIVVGLGYVAHKRLESSNRAKDGMFALKWVVKDGVNYLINPNLATQSIAAITDENLGNREYQQQRQMQVLQNQGRAQLAQAMSNQPVKYVAQAKMIAGAYDRQPRLPDYHTEEDEEIEVTPIVRYDLIQAINESDVDSWYVGQNPDDGHLYNLSINDVVHVGLVGATKTGKTSSTALLMMYYALRNKFLVIAFDGAGGVDWLPYKDYIEVYPVDYTTLPERVNQIVALHERRMRKLQERGVANIDEVTGMKVPHILVIFEEFGYMCQALEAADKKLFKETESRLSNLMRVSRKTGIHFLLVDQNPTRWSQVIKANVKLFIAYKLNGNLGGAINEYHLDKLKNKGQCSIENTFYDTWYTKGEISKLLIDIPKRSGALLGENVTVNVTDNSKGGGENTIIDVTPTPQPVTVNTVNTPVITVNRTENAGNRTVNTDNTVNEPFTLNRGPITQDEKEKVYQIYLDTGKAKNETCRRIWNVPKGKSAGGYLKYLNTVIAEYEGEQ